MDLEQKVAKELARKYGYLPGRARQLVGFVKTIHHFSRYLGENKYYSDSINKRIALISLDCDILALKVDRVRMLAEDFYAQVELSVLTGGKARLEKAEMEAFKKEVESLTQEAMDLHNRAIRLMQDIRKEYGGEKER